MSAFGVRVDVRFWRAGATHNQARATEAGMAR